MSSGYTVSPSSLYDHRDHRDLQDPHNADASHHSTHPTVSGESHLLSPYSPNLKSDSASPAGGSSYTPAESTSTSIYHASEFSSDFDDPFFGVNFNELDSGTPAFLDDQLIHLESDGLPNGQSGQNIPALDNYVSHPVNPGEVPLLDNNSYSQPQSTYTSSQAGPGPQQAHLGQSKAQPVSVAINTSTPQLTPSTNSGGWSSDDSLAPTTMAMAPQSPRVTVSMWDKEGEDTDHSMNGALLPGTGSPSTVRAGISGNEASSGQDDGIWGSNSRSSDRGLAPEGRPTDETPSMNDLAKERESQERNENVAAWMSEAAGGAGDTPLDPNKNAGQGAFPSRDPDDSTPSGELPFGDTTENRHIQGQTYYRLDSLEGGITQADLDIIQSDRNWAAPPMVHAISQADDARHQPQTSQAAIEKFERLYRDTDSIVSRAATWGTRRRSLPSVVDVEGVVSGNFLKKLNINRGGGGTGPSRTSSLLKKFHGVARRPSVSQILKRKGHAQDDAPADDDVPMDRRESRDSLAPPSRTPSWGIKQKPTPSLNTALIGMATGAAAIGASHARNGSISGTPSITSPKSPFSLPAVRDSLRRSRSKSELPTHGGSQAPSYPNLVGMLKKAGGPPIAQLANTQNTFVDQDDDDDDEDDFDDLDIKAETDKMQDIVPTFTGFQEHVLRLNPGLNDRNPYLVDRIAHQMIVRYKALQTSKIKHLNSIRNGKCQSGQLCIALGGSARPLEGKPGAEPMSARPDSSDGDNTPMDGGINTESFPSGIPMPPTAALPAEFECQLCYSNKKFQKPSDWTKHVHEDVQPFTCTWDRCRDPKMFKRKADWVRHENEGHRHLEWWTCDVDDCRHTCYRRDNFLQHLVREHKFAEPKVKTKAAIKKAGGGDTTWQKVEKCHVETPTKPQEEPCRFCSKTFPTWKKLTVHLAKHMEHISLPVLSLVAAKQLEADTIISPVQDPPPRHFGSLPAIKQEQIYPMDRPHALSNPSPMEYHGHQHAFSFQNMAGAQMQGPFYDPSQLSQQFDGDGTHGHHSGLMMPQVTTDYAPQQYHALPVTTGPTFVQQSNAYMGMQNQVEPFPAYNPLGLQDVNGGQLYDGLDPSMQPMDQYSNHGSASPYQRSPHQGHGFYNQ